MKIILKKLLIEYYRKLLFYYYTTQMKTTTNLLVKTWRYKKASANRNYTTWILIENGVATERFYSTFWEHYNIAKKHNANIIDYWMVWKLTKKEFDYYYKQ